jgi:DNA helicase II / ATP-dependent DNA helicase PcrA
MPSPNKIIIASAGSGKTTEIVKSAVESLRRKSAIVTYTNNNTEELREKTFQTCGLIPQGLKISTWFRFLLVHFVRPYQTHLYEPRVSNLLHVSGRSARGIAKANTERYYFGNEGGIYSDKVSEFACSIIEKSNGFPIRRFEQIFDELYIDEVQDLAGYDLELIEILLKSRVTITLVGDTRQATYQTNRGNKNSAFSGAKIINKFKSWETNGLAEIQALAHSYRCVQSICDFADHLFPEMQATESRNLILTGHDGVFALKESDVSNYMSKYNPQPLRLMRTKKIIPGFPMNFGESKGKGFQRTIIFPHENLMKMLRSGQISDLGDSEETKSKVYVGITRAHQSVAFVVPNNFQSAFIETYIP